MKMADEEQAISKQVLEEKTEKMEVDSGQSSQVPRLMITKIVNENFKSYAGVKELGPFHKSFSSIVGPNGSGKSNVIDAMLFVFGYRSKMIRSKKVSQLIHSSANHLNINSCTVSVHFQKIIDLPGDDFEVVPGSEFCVARTARKDNSSDYSINGKKAPFKEVAQLLKSCGIDLDHNRFLILQGEVEQISMMKPKALTEHEEGMLEYLEDIIGSSVYKEPIEVIAKEVEQLNEQRGEKLNRVKAVEKEKDELEGAKDEAVEFIGVENEITRKRNGLYQKYIHECVKNEKQAEEKRNEIKKKFDELLTQLKDCSERKKEKGKEHKKLMKKHEKLNAVAEETKKNFASYERDDLKLREDLKHRKQNSKTISKNLEKEKEKLSKLQGAPDKNKKEVENLEKKKAEFEAQKAVEEEKLAGVMAGLKHETQGIQNEKEAKEAELMELKKAVNETKSTLDVAKSELEIYKSQQDGVLSQRNSAITNLEKAVKKANDRESERKALEKELPDVKKKLQEGEADLKKAIEGEKKASEELRANLRKVEEARSSLQASRSRGKVLESLMQQKASGNIPGIFGRLGDLGSIDDQYDVAISTACGALDNIVCDSIDTAQKCVQFLKQNNVGVATFIGLDKVENLRKDATSKIQTPQNVPRLFDLVRFKDDNFRTAFFYGLRNTLVAKDLEQATKIAYQGSKRWRVVTLQGQLIDQSGTMSGGGSRVMKGRMGSSFVSDVNPQQLSQMEKKLERDTKTAEEFRESKNRLEELVDTLKSQSSSMEHQLDKNNMEMQAVAQQQKDLKEQIKHLDEKVKEAAPDEARLAQLRKTVAQNEKQYQKAADAAAKIETEVQRLHKKIMDISGAKLKVQQNKVDVVNKMIDEVNGHITKANVAIKSSHRNIKKAEDTVASTEKEIEENGEAITKLEKDFETLEAKATQVLVDLENAMTKMQEMEATLKTVSEEFTVLEQEETDLKSKEVDIKHEVEKYEVVYKENQQKVKHWKKELDKLSLQSVGLADDTPQQLETLTEEELETIDKEDIQYTITVLEEKLNSMKPNMAAIAEYRKKEEIYLSRVGELDKVTSERDGKRQEHEALRKKRLEEFMAGFSIITTKLKEMYQMITLGGDAELELVDSLDPFSEGIVFSVRPPKKSWKNIANLSGGEKTLSSLALVFALHHYKPTPLYVMDEIDAALDFRNVSIVANYIKDRTKNAQFIIISLRNNMFELADRLIGIYKTDNCTKSVVINPQLISRTGQA